MNRAPHSIAQRFTAGWRCLLLVLLTLLLSLTAAEALLYSANRLDRHPDWLSGKAALVDELMGAERVPSTRNLLARNRLNLETWFGYQEIYYAHPVRFGRLTADFAIGNGGYFDLQYHRDADSVRAVRLSRQSDMPSMRYTADAAGRFTAVEPFHVEISDGTHKIDLRLRSSKLELMIDETPIFNTDEALPAAGMVGFRGSSAASWIDNVQLWDAEAQPLLFETFRNRKAFLQLACVCALPVLFAIGMLGAFGKLRGGLPYLLLVQSCLLALVLGWLGFDYFYYSRTYPYQQNVPWRVSTQENLIAFEEKRLAVARLADAVADQLAGADPPPSYTELQRFLKLPQKEFTRLRGAVQVARIVAGRPSYSFVECSPQALSEVIQSRPIPARSSVVVMVGTSQMRGEGANQLRDLLAFQTFRKTRNLIGAEADLVFFNLSVSGDRSGEQLSRYRTLRSVLPGSHTLLINLGNNDVGNEQFSSNYTAMLSEHRLSGGAAILLLEARYRPWKSLLTLHDRIREHAKDFGAAVIDLQTLLHSGEVLNSGLMRWDPVHLTSYGQSVAAAYMAQAIADALKTRSEPPHLGQRQQEIK